MPRTYTRASVMGPALAVAAIVAAVMTGFEATKQSLFSGLTLWESHLITIGFTAALAAMVAYAVGKRFAALSRAAVDQEVAEERARTARETQLLIDSTSEGIYGINLKLECTFMNRAMATLIGYSPSEALGKNMHALCHHHRLDGSPYPGEQCPAIRSMREGRRLREDDEVIWRRDGTPIPVQFSASPIIDNGKITGAVITIVDLSASKDSDRELQGILDNSPAVIALKSLDGRYLRVNERFEKIFNLKHGEVVGKTDQDLFPAEIADKFRENDEKVAKAAEPLEFEETAVLPDGVHHYISIKFPLRSMAGIVFATAGISTDITDRKRAEQERARAAHQMELLLASTGQGVYGINLKGECTFLNRAMAQMIGCAPEQAMGKNMHALVHHHRMDGSPYPVEECPIFRALHDGVNSRDDAEVMWSLDGTALPVEYASFPIVDDGSVSGAVVTVTDITERRAAQERILKSAEELRQASFQANAALDLTKSGYWRVPLDGSGTFELSPRAVKIFGQLEREGNRYRLKEDWYENAEAADAEAAQKARELFQTMMAGETESYAAVHAYRRPVDGKVVWLHALGHLIRDAGGRATEIFGVSQDVTESKQMEAELITAKEAAEAAARAKGDFLANMSHEIRTPMNAILGMAHLALKTQLTAKQRDYVTKIQGAGQSLLGIINDILDFSKIEAGHLDIEKIDFHLDEVLENLSTIVGQKAQEKGLEFLISVEPGIPATLVGDPLRLGQILINLVNNALKFTEKGEVVVAARLQEAASGRALLKFSVRDSGIGMTPEQMARLFQPFTQADTSTTRKFGGTGLGLSISKRLVEMMGGSIEVESAAGKGSTFHFTARFGVGEGSVPHKRVAPDLAGVRALVVDDNAQAREIISDSLREFGLSVDTAESGAAAIRRLESTDAEDPFKLVLMDWHMPEMDGLEATRRIKLDQRLKHQPRIVMVTAFGREEVRAQSEELGVEAYLLKPLSPSVLFDTLMSLFGVPGEEGTGGAARPDQPANHDATGVRILLVEDNEVNQQVATELLSDAGAEVTVANHGEEALKLLRSEQSPPFDVVLMDLQMPVMDGHTATKQIRADSRFDALPVIAMTAHALVAERQRCMAAGMNDYVTKPIDPDALFSTLARWTTRRPKAASQATARTAKEAKAPDDTPVPDIEGIDVAGGVKRVAGNKRLYRDLLLQFSEKFGNFRADIIAALASDPKAAERLAHTLKGVAGNLGITAVFKSAEGLEKAIREKDSDSAAKMEELNTLVERQIQAIRSAMPAPSAATQPESTYDAAKAVAAASTLRALLEASDGDSGEAFEPFAAAAAPRVAREKLDAMKAAIQQFDFEGALAKLDEIMKECELHSKGKAS